MLRVSALCAIFQLLTFNFRLIDFQLLTFNFRLIDFQLSTH